MSSSQSGDDFAAKFVSLTGTDTIEEPQRSDDTDRFDDDTDTDALRDAADHAALADAIDDPDTDHTDY
jgi:hypothetical protein